MLQSPKGKELYSESEFKEPQNPVTCAFIHLVQALAAPVLFNFKTCNAQSCKLITQLF